MPSGRHRSWRELWWRRRACERCRLKRWISARGRYGRVSSCANSTVKPTEPPWWRRRCAMLEVRQVIGTQLTDREATNHDRTTIRDRDGTQPISVAELLARNGTIGAPAVTRRRRRRRGDSDAVTVAELTGEIPVIRDDHDEPTRTTRAVTHRPEPTGQRRTAGRGAEPVSRRTGQDRVLVRTRAALAQVTAPDPTAVAARAQRVPAAPAHGARRRAAGRQLQSGAEHMSPDPSTTTPTSRWT